VPSASLRSGTPTSTASAVSHTVPAAGTWTVTLTVTGGWGKAAQHHPAGDGLGNLACSIPEM
jgi:hypothetical protein